MAMWMGDGAGNRPGAAVGLDLGYSYYWDLTREFSFGIRTGLGMEYRGSTLSASIHDAYTNFDYLGHPMDYDISGTARHQLHQLAVSMPLMVGIQANGFTLHLGVRAVVPSLYSGSRQSIDDLIIAATYPEYGVTVVNELFSGRATPDQLHQSFAAPISRFQLLGALEIGYEWSISRRRYIYTQASQSLGVALYADYGLMNISGGASSSARVVDVAPIMNPFYPVPAVTIGSAFRSDASYRYFDVGVRFYYAFNLVHGRRHGWH